MSTAGLASLHALLDALAGEIEGDDHDASVARLGHYDQQLRHWLDGMAGQASRTDLQQLLQRQQHLQERMLQRRSEAGAHLQQGHRGLRAAHAYLKAESLA